MSHEYINDVRNAFACPHALGAIDAYLSLRRALVSVDDLSEDALIALHARCDQASQKYPDDTGRANAAMNAVLKAYATYLNTIIWERDHD